jgi:Flp pilus assembly protein TadG
MRGSSRRLRGEEGVQLVELALVLPLLMVLVVAVFDFGAAFNVKQKLSNVARSAARFGSIQPTNDINNGGVPNPPSIISIRNMVDDSLVAASINDCGLLSKTGAPAGAPQLAWIFTASGNGCPGPFTLTIDRSDGYLVGNIHVISTHINISYPYQWQFGRVFGLVGASATFAGISQIGTDALVPNAD